MIATFALAFAGCDDGPAAPDADLDGGTDSGSDADEPDGADGDVDEPTTVSLILRAPNGGERWPVGSTQHVLWSATGIDQLHIEFSPDDSVTWYDIAAAVDASAGRADWVVPDRESSTCHVRISDPDDAQPSDRSAAPFEIVPGGTATVTITSPMGGEAWRHGEEHEVAWTSTGASETVDIALSEDGGEVWADIATGETDDGTYAWTIPTDVDSNQCRLRVQASDGDPSDVSESFSIRPPLPPEL